jgi:hypothetical protein
MALTQQRRLSSARNTVFSSLQNRGSVAHRMILVGSFRSLWNRLLGSPTFTFSSESSFRSSEPFPPSIV